MSHPFVFARATPDKPAIVMTETGKVTSYRELEEYANRDAHLLRSMGIQRGDCVAAMLGNGLPLLRLAWAADRIGTYFCAISTKLTTAEARYIVEDSNTRVFFTSEEVGAHALEVAASVPAMTTIIDGDGGESGWSRRVADLPTSPVSNESPGGYMLYSSGTTGRPKGVKRPLPAGDILTASPITALFTQVYGATRDSVYLCPAPLYHAAPLGWVMLAHRTGCTVVVMEKFDAESALAAIERYGVTHAQFVPTHFVRMLKLPDEVRRRYDLSSLQTVWHAAAPCPVPVKQAMIDWLGPIVHEYYAGTEANGITTISPSEWLVKPGSVGRPLGCQVHACDENGEPLAPGEEGRLYFAGGQQFEYHNDAEKTAESRNARGWSTLGDVGRVDEDGFLYLTDRASFMIITGGVNVYPQEIENLIVTHPAVADVAVIGVPDDEMGERVVAVIQPADIALAGPALAAEIDAWFRPQLSGVKRPRQIDFTAELPRNAMGKLQKRLLKTRYAEAAQAAENA